MLFYSSATFSNYVLLCIDNSLNSDGVGGILGFLLNSYSRPEDNLPFSANVYFEEDDFEFMKQAGKVGTLDVIHLSLPAAF